MKYYQNKNIGKVFYIVIFTNIIMWGFIAVISLFDFEFVSGGRSIFAGIFSLIIALGVIAVPIYMKINRMLERTVEITKDEIIYREKNKTVRMNWEDVAMVGLNPYFFLSPPNRVVFFTAWGVEPYWKTSKVTDKRIWSEYNDNMIAEIKKYWHGRIVNEDKYLKYKNKKKHISQTGKYRYKQIFGNDDNRYFRFMIRPNALIYDEGENLPNYITNEAYYTRFTTIFGWGGNDTLWIYSSDTGIDYWEIEDGSWKKKEADEESIELAPERIREMI